MTIAKLVREAHTTAKEKGWWTRKRRSLEIAALIHSEISEFVEEERLKHNPKAKVMRLGWDRFDTLKPYGPLIELADAIIRIADFCGERKWNLDKALELKLAYNRTRPYRHGGKRA